MRTSLLTGRVMTAGSSRTVAQSGHAQRGTSGSSSTTRVVSGKYRGYDGRVVFIRVD